MASRPRVTSTGAAGAAETRKAEALRQEVIDHMLGEWLRNQAGRVMLWWIYADLAQAHQPPMAMIGDGAVHMTFKRLGMQVVGAGLAERCKQIDHEAWLVMLKENEPVMARNVRRPEEDGPVAPEFEA